jgi:ABC-type multidrug transport system ATPase subunit
METKKRRKNTGTISKEVIVVNNLRKEFKDIVAVNNISFSVKDGEIFAF